MRRRAWCNGSASAFQAVSAGSIPAARSSAAPFMVVAISAVPIRVLPEVRASRPDPADSCSACSVAAMVSGSRVSGQRSAPGVIRLMWSATSGGRRGGPPVPPSRPPAGRSGQGGRTCRSGPSANRADGSFTARLAGARLGGSSGPSRAQRRSAERANFAVRRLEARNRGLPSRVPRARHPVDPVHRGEMRAMGHAVDA